MLPHDAASLRHRADDLRRFAARVRSSPALLLDRWAGIEVWRGPLPLECVADFVTARRRVLAECDELDAAADRLDHAADELDRAAREHGGAMPGMSGPR